MRILGLAIALAFSLTHTDKAKAATPELKLGYVDITTALNEVEDGKAAKAKLKVDFEGKQAKLDKMQNDLKAKKDDFDKKASMLKPEAKQAQQEEMQRTYMDLQKTYMQLQQELVDRENQITTDIGKKLRAIIEKIGDRDGYTVILNIADNVLYHKRHQDLTDAVVQEYNKQYGKK